MRTFPPRMDTALPGIIGLFFKTLKFVPRRPLYAVCYRHVSGKGFLYRLISRSSERQFVHQAEVRKRKIQLTLIADIVGGKE
jgi:hypothetical protein